MRLLLTPAMLAIAALLSACAGLSTSRPAGWAAPDALVAPSSFTGVHGLAVDKQGRLLAGSVVGNAIWEVDRSTGAAKILVGGPEGQADDIAIGANGEMAWTNYLQGQIRLRERDGAPMRVLATGLPGINSLDFDRRNGKLYASQVFLGDALWEIDVAGVKPPRLIAKDLGGFNGFEVGPDGMLYGPLWFKRSVAKINPADGALTVINADFNIPAAANLDGKGNLWAVDTATGELARINLASGQKTQTVQLKPSLDNLAIAPDGTVYVSNMADNSIQAINPDTGAVKLLTSGKLGVPGGLRLDGDELWVADLFAVHSVNVRSGAVTELQRMHASGGDMEYPFSLGLSAKRVVLASWFTNTVQVINRATRKTEAMTHGWKAPYDAIPLDDGSVLVAEIATGSITRASGPHFDTRTVLVSGLAGPAQMTLGPDGALYVSEAAGNIVKVNLADGSKTTVASGLALPEGLAFTPWGSLVVAETAATKLTEINLASGERRTVADKLPIGLSGGPGMPPPYVPTGVAVGRDGVVYFSADRNNAVYRVNPQR